MNKHEIRLKRRFFIEETIGTRKYFSYRADLLLYKIILCIFIYLSVYVKTSHLFISAFITLQVFLIFTLINKLNIERKEKEGREKLLNKTKREYFEKKLKSIDIAFFEKLIKHYFTSQGYSKYKKIGKHMYSSENSEGTSCIKILKLNSFDEVEKIDIRNLLSFMKRNKINNGFIVTLNEISEDVHTLLDKLKDCLNIKIVNENNIFDFASKNNFLPRDDFFYEKIYIEKAEKSSTKTKIISNAINNKKIIIYIFAAAFFFILSFVMPYNSLSIYLSYYFVVLTVVSAVYFIILKVSNHKVSE